MAISTTFNPNAPSATTGVGSAVSNREDLSNELNLLAPEETPLYSLCAKGRAKSTFHEWTTDKLKTPTTAGRSEGQDYTVFEDKHASRARLGNYVQVFGEPWLVSNLQNAVDSVGPANVAAAEAKSMRELKRSVEATICSDNDRTAENGGGTPYALRGLGDWLDSAGPSDVDSAYRTPTGSILTAAPTEITLNDMIASIFSKNGEMNSLTLIAGITLRKRVAEFTRTDNNASETVYNVMQDATAKRVTLSVQVFDSDFGIVNLVNGNPDCMPSATRGYAVNPKYLGFNTLIPMASTRLENQGGGERGFVEMTGTLVCKHPQAHGKIVY
jgi:hypothetical protein